MTPRVDKPGHTTGAAGGVVPRRSQRRGAAHLRRGKLYASAAIAGTGSYFPLDALGAARTLSTIVGLTVLAGVRPASIWWRLQLPVFRLKEDEQARRDLGT